MISNSHLDHRGVSTGEQFFSEMEHQRMRKALSELYELLEEYAPSWYPERLRKDVEAILQTHEK